MKDHRTPPHACPTCGYILDAVTSVKEDPAPPSDGDLSLCICCASILIFHEGLRLRVLSAEEFVELPFGDRKLIKIAVEAIQARVTKEDALRMLAEQRAGQ